MVPYYNSSDEHLGVVPKAEVHANGLWHKSCLILVMQGGRVLTYTRGNDQSWASCQDILGGHEDEADGGSLVACAVREANEELELKDGAKPELLRIRQHWLRPIGKHPLIIDAPNNREISHLFAMPIALGYKVLVKDEGNSGLTVARESRFMDFEELLALKKAEPGRFADGLARVLEAAAEDRELRDQIAITLACRHWTLYFACTLPGEPGCGCPDGDFLGEHAFCGTREEAVQEAKQINWDKYRGDFRYWIEEN